METYFFNGGLSHSICAHIDSSFAILEDHVMREIEVTRFRNTLDNGITAWIDTSAMERIQDPVQGNSR